MIVFPVVEPVKDALQGAHIHWARLCIVAIILLSAVGTFFTALLLIGPVKIGGLAFDVNTLLFTSITAFIGFQFILFFFQTKIYAINQMLLPESEGMKGLFKYLNLETGLVVSLFFC